MANVKKIHGDLKMQVLCSQKYPLRYCDKKKSRIQYNLKPRFVETQLVSRKHA